MSWVHRFAGSSIGLKFLMAITGVGLFGFLVGHLLGNLLIFQGPDAINGYAKSLKELPYGLLWVARLGLVVLFGVHIFTAIKLNLKNKSARPEKYVHGSTIQASFASRYMVLTGMLIFAFLLYHLAHYTWHVFGEVPVLPGGEVDVYGMVVAGFGQPLIAIIYVVAMLVLGLHLSHGLSSLFRTLGFHNKKYNRAIELGGCTVAWSLALANMSIPMSVWLGFVK